MEKTQKGQARPARVPIRALSGQGLGQAVDPVMHPYTTSFVGI